MLQNYLTKKQEILKIYQFICIDRELFTVMLLAVSCPAVTSNAPIWLSEMFNILSEKL